VAGKLAVMLLSLLSLEIFRLWELWNGESDGSLVRVSCFLYSGGKI
jgi:hypothetical protein